MSAPTISVQNVTVHYQEELLFQNLNLTLQGGACTALLGRSGVGKTTLLRFIAGLTRAGKVLGATDSLSCKFSISYLAQDSALLPWLTTLDNVLIGWRLRGIRCQEAIQDKAIALLKEVGLKNQINKKPAQLSGGMRQRVALVRTLLEDRPIVLMDEPFAHLDVITSSELQDLTAHLLQGRTVFVVTHDPLEALKLANYIYILSGKPAILEQFLELTSKTPRNINDPVILNWHAKLLAQLEGK